VVRGSQVGSVVSLWSGTTHKAKRVEDRRATIWTWRTVGAPPVCRPTCPPPRTTQRLNSRVRQLEKRLRSAQRKGL